MALPPYFPADRNEAFIPIGAAEPSVSALSKTLGLAWRIHQPAVLPLLGRILPKLESPELQDGLDDVLTQVRDPKAAVVVAEMVGQTDDPARKRQLLGTLARKLGSDWRTARTDPQVITATESALNDPELKLQGIEMAAATGDSRYAGRLQESALDSKTVMELRVAAIEVSWSAPSSPHSRRAPERPDRRGQGQEPVQPAGRGGHPGVAPGRERKPAAGGSDHRLRLPAWPAPSGPADICPGQWRAADPGTRPYGETSRRPQDRSDDGPEQPSQPGDPQRGRADTSASPDGVWPPVAAD